MDELTSDFLSAADEANLARQLDSNTHNQDDPETTTPQDPASGGSGPGSGGGSASKARTLRRGIFKAASLQDKLLEKLIAQVIPADDGSGDPTTNLEGAAPPPVFADRPGFTVSAMSNNFRRFNARIGVVFKFQARFLRLLSWRQPSHTLSFLAVYTFVCLDPYLLCVIPLAVALFGIFVPSFLARHPAPGLPGSSLDNSDRVRNLGYSPRGPPLAPARTVKPAKELSRDFFRNMGDLQNVMEDFSVVHDKIVELVVPKTNFSDEALSSAIFVLLSGACAVMTIAAHLLPWRFLALAAGWVGIWSGHPTVAVMMSRAKRQYVDGEVDEDSKDDKAVVPKKTKQNPIAIAEQSFNTWVKNDIILDEAPETREVEIFELQRLVGGTGGPNPSNTADTTSQGEWEPWLFSPSPYDPLSAPRLAGERPRGTRFFEDVLAPEGWEWSEKKWALDLWSREWVEERIITGVEVETEGERWVYDMYNENDPSTASGLAEGNGGAQPPQQQPATGPSWEEGEEGMGRRGEWRRRRWVRTVKRKNLTATA